MYMSGATIPESRIVLPEGVQDPIITYKPVQLSEEDSPPVAYVLSWRTTEVVDIPDDPRILKAVWTGAGTMFYDPALRKKLLAAQYPRSFYPSATVFDMWRRHDLPMPVELEGAEGIEGVDVSLGGSDSTVSYAQVRLRTYTNPEDKKANHIERRHWTSWGGKTAIQRYLMSDPRNTEAISELFYANFPIYTQPYLEMDRTTANWYYNLTKPADTQAA